MERFIHTLNRFGIVGTIVGSCFLAFIIILTVTNVIVRLFGPIIIGAYQLVELSIVFAVALALPYTALKKGHTMVRVVVMRFPERVQALCEAFTSLLGLITWGVIAWASAALMIDRGLAERTELLELPYLPSRCVWVFGLTFSCVIILCDMVIAIKGVFRK
ncbi:TRAP transporter small permease [Thermodesulfobacteriota bacterium]